jgi:hypothetical protein
VLLTIWSVIFVFFWLAFTYLTRGQPTRHLGFFHYLLFFFSIYWGALELYVQFGGINDRFLLSVVLYPIISLLGMLCATLLEGRTNFPNPSIRLQRQHIRLVFFTVVIFTVVYGIYLITLGENIPLLVSLREKDSLLGHMARYAATKGYRESIFHIGFFYWFPRILIDYFGVFVVVFFYFHLKRRISDYLRFFLLIFGLVLMALMANEKYPVVKLLALLALCLYNVKYPRLTLRSFRHSLIAGAALVVLVGLVYSLVTGAHRNLSGMGAFEAAKYVSIDKGWALLTTRGMTGQGMPLYMIYRIIPEQYDYFMGRTFTNPHRILPYDPVALPYLVYASYNPPTKGLRGADPTIFFGEIYANFGLGFSFLSMFLFGALLQILNSRLSARISQDKSPLALAYFYLWMAYLGDFAIGFSVPYFDERVWFFIGFYILGRFLQKRGPVTPAGTDGLQLGYQEKFA